MTKCELCTREEVEILLIPQQENIREECVVCVFCWQRFGIDDAVRKTGKLIENLD